MTALIIGVSLIFVAINLIVTVWVTQITFLTPKQKLAQVLLIWLVPILGAIVIMSFLLSNREHIKSQLPLIPLDSDYPGINLD